MGGEDTRAALTQLRCEAIHQRRLPAAISTLNDNEGTAPLLRLLF